MDAPSAQRPRAVTVIGWIWLVVATLRFVDGLLGYFVWKVGGLDRGIPFLSFRSGGLQVRAMDLDFFVRHATEFLVAQILVAAAVAYAAFELLRLKPWARRAIEVFAWLGILVTLATALYTFAWTVAVARETPAEAEQIRIAGLFAAIAIALIGSALFGGGTIYFLRRPAVRRAFETQAA
jgi:hypothetical protein